MSSYFPHPASEIPPAPAANDCWFLTGPTAAGKTAVGIQLAQRINAEIVALDSMTVYAGMDIGTAKPNAEQRAAVPHHLLDVAVPGDDYSLSQYINAAHHAIADIRSRSRQVLFVGGTALYLKSLLRGVYQGPPADWEFREQIEQEVEQVGVAALHQRLAMVDPLAAAKLHQNDKRRIIRALEVYRQTGQPLSHRQTQFDEGRPADQSKVFVLQWPREVLHRRIEERVEQMFSAGLVDEVRGLLATYGSLSRTASQAVGYREVLEHLSGHASLVETAEKVKARTRQFARRQETWFRGLSECTFVQLQESDSAEQVAMRLQQWGTTSGAILTDR